MLQFVNSKLTMGNTSMESTWALLSKQLSDLLIDFDKNIDGTTLVVIGRLYALSGRGKS